LFDGKSTSASSGKDELPDSGRPGILSLRGEFGTRPRPIDDPAVQVAIYGTFLNGPLSGVVDSRQRFDR